MRWTGTCWSCTFVLLFRDVLAEISVLKNPNKKPVETYIRRINEVPPTGGGQERLRLAVIEAATRTCAGTRTNTIYHLKTTPAPKPRRKLGSNKWETIHDGIQGQKRDAASCPTDYQLCPQSVGGGCCPNDRVCGTNSCYPVGAAPASACGVAGYIACGINDGGEYIIPVSCLIADMCRWMLSFGLCLREEWVYTFCRSFLHGNLRS